MLPKTKFKKSKRRRNKSGVRFQMALHEIFGRFNPKYKIYARKLSAKSNLSQRGLGQTAFWYIIIKKKYFFFVFFLFFLIWIKIRDVPLSHSILGIMA